MEHKEYYAFISYKREDEEWAKWLAHKLEHYNLPTTLNGKELPKNLRPVFRDTDELSAGNLPKQIYHALSISKNLIVVCSPRSAQSEWVNKEITDFIDIKGGNSENIFPFIINGIPHSKDSNNECFPETLRCLPGDEERLGGNINDQGGREAAVVKIISGMLGVSFDSLWHKHEREQKRKRIAFIIASLLFAFVCLIVGGYIAFQNIELDVAKKEISKQRDIAIKEKERAERVNASLVIANDSIKIQKDKVSAINDELLKTNKLLTIERDNVLKSNRKLKLSNSIIRSENALALMRNGNLLKAKNVLKEICTDDDATKLVKQSEVEYALRTVHREWEKDGFKSRFTLEEIGDISFAKFDETGNNLYVCVNDTSVLSVDAKSGLIYNVHNLSLSHDIELVSYDFDNVKGNIFYTIDNLPGTERSVWRGFRRIWG